ncbi:MAG TPA: cupin domain-containing protein [Pyrinomonadaceae bacterium]|jgi:quercetin dioxygenase-like cupin family protein|nr:cupin domain-containing protein [Pyrinomonadaceae bacterium]
MTQSATQQTDATFIRSNEAKWTSEVPGVFENHVFVNQETGERTVFVRFEPGASYPLHNHPGKEEIVVLEGEVKVGKYQMTAGDYLLTPPEGKHAVTSVVGGLVVVKLDKATEFIAPRS